MSNNTTVEFNDSSSSTAGSLLVNVTTALTAHCNTTNCGDFDNPYSCYVLKYIDCGSGAVDSLWEWINGHQAGIGGSIGAIVGLILVFCALYQLLIYCCCIDPFVCCCVCCCRRKLGRKNGYTPLAMSDLSVNSTNKVGSFSSHSILGSSNSILDR